MPRRTLRLPFTIDLRRSLQPLRLGKHDPTIQLADRRVLRAVRTPAGPATVDVQHLGDRLAVEAWGAGAEWALEQAPAAVGLLDDRAGFDPAPHPLVQRLHRDGDGLRLPSTGLLLEALLPAVLSQRVTGFEAKRSFRQLVERWGEPAPGPGRLLLAPEPRVIAALGYYELHVVGVEKRRADALKRVSAHATRLQGFAGLPGPELRTHLEALPGIGVWTSAEVARVVTGDADAVSVGDFHLKHLVAHALAGEPRGTDDRMLELLEPFAGHRGRVCVLIESAGITAPKLGPRQRIPALPGR
jgi:3-methyladenine DNA glycosylase/8-oxoguanine DNA glycosylase